MRLVCTHLSLATVEELFQIKADPTYQDPAFAPDEWGIKAHNRPWVAANGRWAQGQTVIEPGGAYSLLPEWLAKRHGVDAWIGDDFGVSTGEELWSRWGDPSRLPQEHPLVTYRFENFGPGSPYPSGHFDRIFTVSTLEHIEPAGRPGVLADLHRCLKPGGVELHTIDIGIPTLPRVGLAAALEAVGAGRLLHGRYPYGIAEWIGQFRRSGVRFPQSPPNSARLLDYGTLLEPPERVFNAWPPNEEPKPYRPSASLLLIIEDQA